MYSELMEPGSASTDDFALVLPIMTPLKVVAPLALCVY